MNETSKCLHGIVVAALAWLAVAQSGPAEDPEGQRFETRIYPTQPGVFRTIVELPERGGDARTVVRDTVKKFFEEAGVPFPEGAIVTYDDRLSHLIVRNTKENLELFERVLRQLNVEATQVTIEARWLQMARTTANDLFQPEPTLGKVSVIKDDILRRIREFEDQKKIRVLAQPKVTTVSGNTAQVKSVEEYRYPTKFSVEPSATTNAPSRVTTEDIHLVPGGFETRELGTLLNVTPTVGPEGQIVNLTLVPEISSLGAPHKIEVSFPGGKVMVEQPRFRSRQVTTTVQILSGTTILLGVADPIEGEDPDYVTLILLTAAVVGIR